MWVLDFIQILKAMLKVYVHICCEYRSLSMRTGRNVNNYVLSCTESLTFKKKKRYGRRQQETGDDERVSKGMEIRGQ